MSINKYLIIHTNTNTQVSTNISDAVVMDQTNGIEANANSFGFSVYGDKYDNFFNDGDSIKIYLWKDGDNPSSGLIMDGFIKEIRMNITADKKTFSITGLDRMEVLLNAPIPAAYTSSSVNNTVPKIIVDLINKAQSQYRLSKYQPTISAKLKSAGGYVDDQTYTIQTIPTSYYAYDTPVFQQIKQLTSPKWTGVDILNVGNYIYYLDSSNNFHWEPKNNLVQSTVSDGDYISCKIEKTLFDVINFAIIYAGRDFNGKPIKTYAYNTTGQVKGFRGKYFSFPEIAESLKKPKYSQSKPFSDEDVDGNTNNDTFRNKVLAAAKSKGQTIVNTFGQPRFKADIIVKGSTGYNIGYVYNIATKGIFRDINDIVVSTLPLRLYNISHSFSTKGWTTRLDLRQDEITVTGYV